MKEVPLVTFTFPPPPASQTKIDKTTLWYVLERFKYDNVLLVNFSLWGFLNHIEIVAWLFSNMYVSAPQLLSTISLPIQPSIQSRSRQNNHNSFTSKTSLYKPIIMPTDGRNKNYFNLCFQVIFFLIFSLFILFLLFHADKNFMVLRCFKTKYKIFLHISIGILIL